MLNLIFAYNKDDEEYGKLKEYAGLYRKAYNIGVDFIQKHYQETPNTVLYCSTVYQTIKDEFNKISTTILSKYKPEILSAIVDSAANKLLIKYCTLKQLSTVTNTNLLDSLVLFTKKNKTQMTYSFCSTFKTPPVNCTDGSNDIKTEFPINYSELFPENEQNSLKNANFVDVFLDTKDNIVHLSVFTNK